MVKFSSATTPDSSFTCRPLTSRVPRERILKEWTPWCRKVASAYTRGLESRLSEEDLLQEAQIAILNALEKHSPLGSDFAAILKQHAVNAIIDVVRRHRTKGRDVRREIRLSAEDDSDPMERFQSEFTPEPIQKVIEREAFQEVISSLSKGARKLMRLLIKPNKELRQAYQRYVETHRFPRHNQIPSCVYAEVLGVSRTKAKELLRELHEALVDRRDNNADTDE